MLKILADVASAQLKPKDALVRLGGDEFLVILPKATAAEAKRVAEGIRTAFAAAIIPLKILAPSPTISTGITTRNVDQAGWEAVLRDADTALYQAKSRGRDCIAA